MTSTEIIKSIQFFGQTPLPKDSLTADAFLRAISDRQSKNGLDGKQTMSAAIASLHGLAADWWHDLVMMYLTPEETILYNSAEHSYNKLFLPMFQDRWKVTKTVRNIRMNKLTVKQRNDELGSDYVDRIMMALARFKYTAEPMAIDDPQCTVLPNVISYTIPATAEAAATVGEEVLSERWERRLVALQAEWIQASALHTYNRMNDAFTKCLILEGVKPGPLMTKAHDSVELPLLDFARTLRNVEIITTASTTQNNKNNKKDHSAVSAVVDLNDENDDEANAVKAANKKSNKKSKYYCTYCKKPGHSLERCRSKDTQNTTAAAVAPQKSADKSSAASSVMTINHNNPGKDSGTW